MQLRLLAMDQLIYVGEHLALRFLEPLGLEILHLLVDFPALLLRVGGDGLHKFADFLVAVRHNVTVPFCARTTL